MAEAAKKSMAVHVRAMLEFHKLGIPTFDYGNNIRQVAFDEGVKDAFAFPGFVPAYIRPLLLPRRRAVPLGRAVGRSGGHPQDRREGQRADAGRQTSAQLARHGRRAHQVPGPARRASAGSASATAIASVSPSTRWWRRGELKAPVVIGRDHLDSGSVASPNRETEAMQDGSDAVSDWPLLNALLNTASGATWVSLHHGGGVGMGFSQHAGMVIVCDGTRDASERIARVLWNDPGDRRHAARRCGLSARDRARSQDEPRSAEHLTLPRTRRAPAHSGGALASCSTEAIRRSFSSGVPIEARMKLSQPGSSRGFHDDAVANQRLRHIGAGETRVEEDKIGQ